MKGRDPRPEVASCNHRDKEELYILISYFISNQSVNINEISDAPGVKRLRPMGVPVG